MEEKLKKHRLKNRFLRIERKVNKYITKIERGYISKFSNKFLIIQESDDFEFKGFSIFKLNTIISLRFNKYDKFYDEIMKSECVKINIDNKGSINIDNWNSIFNSLSKDGRHVIIECEKPKDDLFIIGKIINVNKKSVDVKYFDAAGVWDKKLTKVRYKQITKILFHDRYIDVMSKYLKPE